MLSHLHAPINRVSSKTFTANFSDTLENLNEIHDAYNDLALIASQSDVSIESIATVIRQINKNLATELEVIRSTTKTAKV